jgi:hypothetical protein
MKKVLIILLGLLAMVAFVSGVAMAQADRPQLGSAQEEKLQTSAKLQAVAVVTAYDAAAKTLKVNYKDKEYDLTVADDATIKGAVKPGAKVKVDFKKEGGKRIATSISVMSSKRAARHEKAKGEAAAKPKEADRPAVEGKVESETAKEAKPAATGEAEKADRPQLGEQAK